MTSQAECDCLGAQKERRLRSARKKHEEEGRNEARRRWQMPRIVGGRTSEPMLLYLEMGLPMFVWKARLWKSPIPDGCPPPVLETTSLRITNAELTNNYPKTV